MNMNVFHSLAKIFNEHGFRLYMVGGTSRDYLLGLDVSDFDFSTDATPDEMEDFLPSANYTFAKYGTIRLSIENIKVDITTLRLESEYTDFRHPHKIEFTKSLEKDFVRRDFTINAIYIDENNKVIDYCGGITDLQDGIIRFISDPFRRIEEDPLRILRAERFQKRLGFSLDRETARAIEELRPLLKELNPDKVREESRKK